MPEYLVDLLHERSDIRTLRSEKQKGSFATTPAKIILAQLTAQKGKYENSLEILNSLSEDTLITTEELEYLIACNKIVSKPQQMNE